jgi:hypothetical protein
MFPFIPYASPEGSGPTLDAAGHETSIPHRPTPAFPLQVLLNQQPSVSPELNGVTPTMESMLDLLNGGLEDLDNTIQALPNTALEVSPDVYYDDVR